MSAIDWLLESDEPAVRYLTRRDLLGEDALDDAAHILDGPKVKALFAGQQPDGGFGYHPYTKFGGRALAPGLAGRARGAARRAACARRARDRADVVHVTGAGEEPDVDHRLFRRCASMEGNALAVTSRLGLAHDPRAEQLARSLVEWQWPDGGWNCDKKASGRSSSFHESLPTMWGLHEYATATGAEWARDAAERAAEMFLEHRLFRSLRTGKVLRDQWLSPRQPPYWHYDILQGLLILSRMGRVTDPRAADALEVLGACAHRTDAGPRGATGGSSATAARTRTSSTGAAAGRTSCSR